jgi:GT2 family glycosyltransferase
MKSKNLPVIAVIATYNEEENLAHIVDDVKLQNYDDAYVLDDASTDNTYELARSLMPDIQVIRGEENVGAGANRNRIIAVMESLGYSAILHFLDGDLRLTSQETPNRARELGSEPGVGFTTGLITLSNGEHHAWNYGPAYSLPHHISSKLHWSLFELGKRDHAAAQRLRAWADNWSFMREWPNPLENPVARDIYWGSEANMVIRSDVFMQVNGYDENLRYHEVMELAMRLDALGLRRRFDPSISVMHKTEDLEGRPGKKQGYNNGHVYIARKMGAKTFLLGSSKTKETTQRQNDK